jgi:hypothetical protein
MHDIPPPLEAAIYYHVLGKCLSEAILDFVRSQTKEVYPVF